MAHQDITRRSSLAGLTGLALAPSFLRPAKAASGEPIRIGTVSQLTGALAIVGNEILTGARIAVDQINQDGGLLGRFLELLPRDDKSNPNEALAAAQSLIGAGARFIVGPVTTANANAMLPVVKQGDALLVGPALAGMSLTHENYIPNFVRMSTNSWMNGNGMAEVMARTYPGVLNWGCVIPDQAFAHDYWAAFQAGISRFVPQYSGGAQPRFSEPIQTKYGATDFKNELFKLSTSSTQGLMVALTGADGITFYSQMHGFGLGTRLKAIIDVAAELTLGRALKGNLPPNLWSYSPWFYGADDQNGIGKRLIADYKTATGHDDPAGLVEAAHCCVLGLAAGIRAAGSADPQKVIAAMSGLEFQSAAGPVVIRGEDHQMLGRMTYLQLEPDPAPSGWRVSRQATVQMADLVEPSSPGQKFSL